MTPTSWFSYLYALDLKSDLIVIDVYVYATYAFWD